MVVVGARPQFIKSAPVIKEIITRHEEIQLILVHSGQHYDPEMSTIFFHELRIPRPIVNLQVGSGSHATQTADIMKGLERPIMKTKPDLLVVPGDTNTTLAAALTAVKLGVRVAHIEAGLRSGDMSMPEEINRKLTDHCSHLLFAPTHTAVRNLTKEGLRQSTYLTGDTMVDSLYEVMPLVRRMERSVLERIGLGIRKYVLVTLHRPSNVDDLDRLHQVQLSLLKVAKKLTVVFPVHPRTHGMLAKLGGMGGPKKDGINFEPPQGYIETLALLRNASCVLTDSGGVQKEAFLLHVPCITLRSKTEWPETFRGRANQLIMDPKAIPNQVFEIAFNDNMRKRIASLRNPFGDGHASRRIVSVISKAIQASPDRPGKAS